MAQFAEQMELLTQANANSEWCPAKRSNILFWPTKETAVRSFHCHTYICTFLFSVKRPFARSVDAMNYATIFFSRRVQILNENAGRETCELFFRACLFDVYTRVEILGFYVECWFFDFIVVIY